MATMPTRQLGKDGPHVSALGFGVMGLSAYYGKADPDEERYKVLDRALELGITHWDSADVYGDSEELLGRWFARTGKRDEVFLATKFAMVQKDNGELGVRSDPEYVKQACERSLKRLGLPYIDLYYCHRVDKVTPIEKTVEAMAELKKEGKIRHIGLSEVSAATLRRAYAVHPIAAVQVEYSPFALDIESEQVGLLRACRALGVAVVAYSPLGRGFLTGRFRSPDDFDADDFRRISPRFAPANFAQNLRLVDALAALAQRKRCTPGQLTLAWLLAQGADVLPIPGTKKLAYLEENAGAAQVRLTDAEAAEIRRAVEAAEVHGERYPAEMMSVLFADTPPLESSS